MSVAHLEGECTALSYIGVCDIGEGIGLAIELDTLDVDVFITVVDGFDDELTTLNLDLGTVYDG